MNTIAANELKRRGINVIEKLIAKGPVHVMKRNRPVCVVLTEEEYERLVQAAEQRDGAQQVSVMEWFSLPPLTEQEKSELDHRLSVERSSWEQS